MDLQESKMICQAGALVACNSDSSVARHPAGIVAQNSRKFGIDRDLAGIYEISRSEGESSESEWKFEGLMNAEQFDR